LTTAIRIEGLSKQYTLGETDRTLRDTLGGMVHHPWRSLRRAIRGSRDETFWALKDVTLEIEAGEVLGVVGRNGAGKSTLLKILSRVTDPTRGQAVVYGRLASLLEVGTGFHPDLTGRENIYLNATILGMRRREIVQKFDDIVAFSGVERFLDTPVKRYSSGMYVRLAFAIAAHVDADVLLVDEVLAVGDAEFQKRCLGRMDEVAKSGRTVIFVSHNAMALRNLCSVAVLLDEGSLVTRGAVTDVLAQYSARGRRAARTVRGHGSEGSEQARISAVSVAPIPGTSDDPVRISGPFVIRIDIELAQPAEIGAFLHCHDADQTMVFSGGTFFDPGLNGRVLAPGAHTFECTVGARLLNDGAYTLDVMLVRERHAVVASELSILSFDVIDDTPGVPGWNWRPRGVVRPPLAWRHVPPGSVPAEP
jgi:lipopolysaccharide transport system ATP-binding protein